MAARARIGALWAEAPAAHSGGPDGQQLPCDGTRLVQAFSHRFPAAHSHVC